MSLSGLPRHMKLKTQAKFLTKVPIMNQLIPNFMREGDYVTEDTNPDKCSFDHISGDGFRWRWCLNIQVLCLLYIFFL